MLDIKFTLPEVAQLERATMVKKRGGAYHNYFSRYETKWAGNLLGRIAKGKPDQYLTLLDENVVVYKGLRQALFTDGAGAVLAYIASGVNDFCYRGINLHPMELTDQMRHYLPLLVVKDVSSAEPLPWYEAKPPEENRFEGLVDW
jgi:hypothetical protein